MIDGRGEFIGEHVEVTHHSDPSLCGMSGIVVNETRETLVIKKINPPLESYADNVTCWDVVRDDLLVGVFEPWLFTPYYIGEIQGDVVGSMACFTSVENPEVGLVEFVNT